jgi:hypothetical protein
MDDNPFAALATPSTVLDPDTFSSSITEETLNLDFTFAFAASQGIVTPIHHSKQYVIGYLGTVCQVVLHPDTLPTISEECLPTGKSAVPHQISTAHLGIADSGATYYFFREKSYFIS